MSMDQIDDMMDSEYSDGYAASLGLRYPLDATQLPRLLNLRIEKAMSCVCDRCGDLLEKLHKTSRLLEREHQAEAPGVEFWRHKGDNSTTPHFEVELDSKLNLSTKTLTRHDEFIDSLLEVEHDWQRSQRSTCNSEDTDNFWISHFRQLKESIAAQRPSDEEDNLDELRALVMPTQSAE